MPSTTAISDDDYDEIASYIRQERPRSLTKEESLDILRLNAELRRDGQMQVSSTIGRLLGRSQKVVKEIWSQYLRSKNVLAVPPPSNQVQRTTRIPHTHAVTSIVREFIPTRSVTRVRTVANDVMALLLEAKIIHYDVNCKPEAVNCLRRVQQFLLKLGFKRGKRRGHAAYAMSSAHATARDVCVQHMMQLAPATPVVYLDESYIHHHYAGHHDSLYDPTTMAPPKKCIKVAVSMARARGHDVVFTPPHHSDLQPIEMVSAKVKGDVGVQYTVDTTFADVRSRLDAAFVSLPSDVVWNCVRHCNKLLQETYELLLANDDEVEDGMSSDDASEDSSDSDSD
ncbi:hypothetical protein H257_01402 [Aphanomyces astaci]|uniref:Tc1-like transposase DDE domain-containing protein n=1 Tax=Aphanomyces astaci TaxID=112090 RepID=W4H7Y6_APHAT|nr:hypothetical protein H257_01402 [Aphanomyces astaci]ETV88017.1 hypothetical protein H257_01402 [Aphanomyces astaci]|eukprot:XP_009822880.1 hypothetical protein H257_01402 [Aphanomyces astaci]